MKLNTQIKRPCIHKNTEIHKHCRLGYPFGKTKTKRVKRFYKDAKGNQRVEIKTLKVRAKPHFYGVKKITSHCKECKKILYEYKTR